MPSLAIRRLAMVALFVCAPRVARPQATGALAGVRLGVTTQPDSVTVGDPLTLRVRVSAPPGATIAVPAGPDSGAAVQAIASRSLATNPAAGLAGMMVGGRRALTIPAGMAGTESDLVIVVDLLAVV